MVWFIHPSWRSLNGGYLKRPPMKGWGPSFAVSWPSRTGLPIWRTWSLSHSLRCGGNLTTFGKGSMTFKQRVLFPPKGCQILHHCSKVNGQDSRLPQQPPCSLLLPFSSSCRRSLMSFVNPGLSFKPTWMPLVSQASSRIKGLRSWIRCRHSTDQ
jgi:hypothetical protein